MHCHNRERRQEQRAPRAPRLQLGAAVIPRSSKPERILENGAVFDFGLSDAQLG